MLRGFYLPSLHSVSLCALYQLYLIFSYFETIKKDPKKQLLITFSLKMRRKRKNRRRKKHFYFALQKICCPLLTFSSVVHFSKYKNYELTLPMGDLSSRFYFLDWVLRTQTLMIISNEAS